MKLPQITNAGQLELLVEEIGLLPFFRCGIPGFSLEECTPVAYWFVDGVEGPWQWREQIAAKGNIAYGKLFDKKAGFVSMNWYPDLCNYRRDGYDFDARYEDGLATRKCKTIVDLLTEHGPLLTGELKSLGGFGKGGTKGFETAITALQMQTYVTVQEFVYKRDRVGTPYGWGVARYALSESVFGALPTAAYEKQPEQSKRLLIDRIAGICPFADEKQIVKLIR